MFLSMFVKAESGRYILRIKNLVLSIKKQREKSVLVMFLIVQIFTFKSIRKIRHCHLRESLPDGRCTLYRTDQTETFWALTLKRYKRRKTCKSKILRFSDTYEKWRRLQSSVFQGRLQKHMIFFIFLQYFEIVRVTAHRLESEQISKSAEF